MMIGSEGGTRMAKALAPIRTRPGAVVCVDPRLEALLALNLLDDEAAVPPPSIEPPRFRHGARTEERIPVLSR